MTQFASASFTGANGSELSSVDSNFAKIGTCDNAVIQANRVIAASGSAPPRYYHSATPPSADYEVSCDIYLPALSTSYSAGPLARSSTTSLDGYWARWRSGTGLQLFKYVSGTATQLGSTANTAHSAGTTFKIKLRCTGSTIEVYEDAETTPRISVTDTTFTAAGRAGFLTTCTDAATGTHLDNFSADTLGDSVVPTLTSPGTSSIGSTTVTGNVTTDEANGTLYCLVTINATETVATVKASGVTQAITTTGAKSINVTGLTASTTYYAHFVHTDAAANDSVRVSSPSFTTNSLLTLPPLKNNTGALLANETGATAYVYATSGAHVVTKTAQVTNSSGIMTISDAALTAATQYRVVVVLASGAEGMDKVTAA